jgi:hypothetical protein
MRLAGTYHPIEYLLERSSELFPGLVSIDACWKSQNKDLHYTLKKQLDTEELFTLQKWRKKQLKQYWSNSSNLITNTPKESAQTTLYDEESLRVLLLFFKSSVDGGNDLLILHFPRNYSIQQMDLHFSSITTTEKNMLSNMISSILHAEFDRVEKERVLIQLFSEHAQSAQNEVELLQQKLKFTEDLFSQSLRFFVDDFVQELEKELNCQFEISNEFIQKLAQSHISFNSIQQVIKNALYAAFHLFPNQTCIHVPISLLKIEQETKEVKSLKTNHKDKTIDLLDRYETAALRCNQMNQPVNGKNIAAHLDPPITPPAITDAIKKHKQRIQLLLDEFPSKWTSIRSGLRPIAQMSNTFDSRRNLTGS